MVYQKPHGQARCVPTACDQSPKGRRLSRLRISVKGLRIEMPGEFDNLSLLNRDGTELMNCSGQIILEIAIFLWSSGCHGRTETPLISPERLAHYCRSSVLTEKVPQDLESLRAQPFFFVGIGQFRVPDGQIGLLVRDN